MSPFSTDLRSSTLLWRSRAARPNSVPPIPLVADRVTFAHATADKTKPQEGSRLWWSSLPKGCRSSTCMDRAWALRQARWRRKTPLLPAVRTHASQAHRCGHPVSCHSRASAPGRSESLVLRRARPVAVLRGASAGGGYAALRSLSSHADKAAIGPQAAAEERPANGRTPSDRRPTLPNRQPTLRDALRLQPRAMATSVEPADPADPVHGDHFYWFRRLLQVGDG